MCREAATGVLVSEFCEEARLIFVLVGQILSMSRLGGAGAVASTASDHPAEVVTTFCQECNCYYVAMCLWNRELHSWTKDLSMLYI